MRTSNHALAAIGLLLLPATTSHADVASFAAEQGKLTGTLQSITQEGIIEWQSPYSKEPLKLLADKLKEVSFSDSAQSSLPAPIQLTLRNGDVMPVKRVSGLEEAGLITETTAAGTLTIPRSALSSAQFGVTNQNVIYTGFDSIREWTTGIGKPDNWQRRGNGLVSSGTSIAARDFELPENFILSFALSWETRSPNFSIGFADSLVKDARKQNRYSFDFDSSGIRITRHAPGDTSGRTLAQWQRRPTHFPNNSFKVELKVDRSKRRMEVFIDGESEGLVVDTLHELPVPKGNGVIIDCRTHSGKQTITMLTIAELNDIRTRHLTEKRGDPSLDCLITTEEDRWSGELRSMAGTPDKPLMVFKTSFADEAWEIPESEISTIFFANNPFKDGPGGEPVFHIEFHDSGKLSVGNCTVNGDQVEAVHPLLGALQLERKAIKLIRRIDP